MDRDTQGKEKLGAGWEHAGQQQRVVGDLMIHSGAQIIGGIIYVWLLQSKPIKKYIST